MILKIIILIWLLLFPLIPILKKYIIRKKHKKKIISVLHESYVLKQELIATLKSIQNIDNRIKASSLKIDDKKELIDFLGDSILRAEDNVLRNNRAITTLEILLYNTARNEKETKRLNAFLISLKKKYHN